MVRTHAASLAVVCVMFVLESACHHHYGGVASRRVVTRVYRARTAADLVPGAYGAGRPGDIVLENRFVRAVIDDLPQGGGFALSGGQLVDLAAAGGIDELGQVFSFLGGFPRQLRYEELRTDASPDGTARVIVRGPDPRTPGLDGETVYSLGPDDRAITLTTTLHNRGLSPTEVGLGDAIQWAGAEHWVPGFGFSAPRQSQEPYLAGVGKRTAYAYIGERPLSGPNGSNWSNPTQGSVTLAPGGEMRYVRRIGVAARADVSMALVATGRFHPGSLVTVSVHDERGVATGGVRVVLRDAASRAPLALVETDARGLARAEVAQGSYVVELQAPGRVPDATTRVALLPAVATDTTHPAVISATLGPQSTLGITVRDERGAAVPGRVMLQGLGETATPSLGGIGRADSARNGLVLGADGSASVPLAPGRYRVIATRGPLYALGEADVVVASGAHATVTLVVPRVVPVDDDACGDFHVHQAPSLDAPVSLRDRVRAAAAEGLDVIAATDHNVVTDLAPAIRDEHLETLLLGLVGDELSTDAALHPSGHWNLYPLDFRADAPLGGAPELFELSPRELVLRARRFAPGAIVQVNHPRSGVPTGMFDVVGFDPVTARATRGDMAATFDVLEVWNGRTVHAVDTVLLDWFALLRAGARITGTANSDSHAIVVQEIGYPRTCFHSGGGGTRVPTVGDVLQALRVDRDAVLTDGPMIHVSAPGLPRAIGRVVPGSDPFVTLTVRVDSARWNAPDSLEVLHPDGRAEPVSAPFALDGQHIHAEATVTIARTEGFVLFRARGTSRIPVLVDDPALMPLAITNPIYLRP